MTTSFQGFPPEALDFYDDLEMDNTKSFWSSHKDVYERAVRTPMLALTTALGPEFGEAKVFRPYRDVRFAKDKTPYKTHQGAFVAAGPATGWYVEVSAAGVRVAVGYYHVEPERLARIRTAIADERTGPAFADLVAGLAKTGWTLGGETLKTTPRGYDATHPRIDLLRHKSLTLFKSYGFEPVVHTSRLLTRVRRDWRAARPLIEWVSGHA
jgi:uncharacterized protein (TIGR02453 family)